MKEIELTKGYKTLVDDDVYKEASKFLWYADVYNDGANVYARNLKYGRLHRFIFEVIDHINIDGKTIDHIDNDGLHNYRSNFRIVSRRENSRNQKSRKSSPNSPYIGVSWREHTKRWQAQIRHDGKLTWLGYFNTPEEAGMAYDRAVLYYFPAETSVLNFPDRVNEHDLSLPYERKFQKLRPTNTTGYRGVHEKYKGFGASIGIGGRQGEKIHLGTFKNPVDAAIAYDKAYIILKGGNRDVLNFPDILYTENDLRDMRLLLDKFDEPS